MNVGTVTSKGQITIPSAIRELAGLEPGVRVEFVVAVDGTIQLLPLTGTAEAFFKALEGFERTAFAGTDEQAIAESLREVEPPKAPVNPGRSGESKRAEAGTRSRGRAA